MDDDKNPVASQQGTGTPTAEPQPASINSPETKGTEGISEGKPEGQPTTPTATPQAERTVPYQALDQERRRRKELQKELEKLRNQPSQMGQYDPNDLESVRSHPYVSQLEQKAQEFEFKQKLTELGRGAEDLMKRYPQIPEAVRKAIIRNPRGFVGEETTDVANALLDIEDYILGYLEEAGAQAPAAPQPKQFPVAGMSTPKAVQPASTPAEVQKVLAKPVDTWSEADAKLMEEHAKAQGIRLPE